jgi:ABC-type sugar transport system substrate-binding protein
MHFTFRARLAAVTIAIGALGATACGSRDDNGGPASAGATAATTTSTSAASGASAAVRPFLRPPTKLVVTDPLSKTPPKKKGVFLSNGIEIAQQISAGMRAASEALGWRYSTLTVDQNNPSTIPSAMLAAINNGADVVFVSATPVEVYKPALAEAKKHGTVIVDVASGNPPTDGVAALVNNASQNGPMWGKMAATGILADAEKAGQTAKILLATVPAFDTILGPTGQAAKATVAKLCSECSIDTLGIDAARVFTGKAPSDIVSYIQRHPDVNYILQDSSLTDQGLTAALKSAGLDKVKVYGVAPLRAQAAAVKSGDEAGWVVDPLQVEGWMSVDAAARAFTGDDPGVYDRQAIPSYLLTPDNSDGPLEVPTDYADQFKAMWKLND